jgi:hypothetical protein
VLWPFATVALQQATGSFALDGERRRGPSTMTRSRSAAAIRSSSLRPALAARKLSTGSAEPKALC